MTSSTDDTDRSPGLRAEARRRQLDQVLESALRKREAKVPSYTVPEAASLFSVSQEHLYRLVRTGAFPAVRMHGRYIVPAAVVDELLSFAASGATPVELAEWATGRAAVAGGAA